MARTKGSYSCVYVSLADLNGVLKPNASVLISRRYANQIGLQGTPTPLSTENIIAAGNPVAVTEVVDSISCQEVE